MVLAQIIHRRYNDKEHYLNTPHISPLCWLCLPKLLPTITVPFEVAPSIKLEMFDEVWVLQLLNNELLSMTCVHFKLSGFILVWYSECVFFELVIHIILVYKTTEDFSQVSVPQGSIALLLPMLTDKCYR